MLLVRRNSITAMEGYPVCQALHMDPALHWGRGRRGQCLVAGAAGRR